MGKVWDWLTESGQYAPSAGRVPVPTSPFAEPTTHIQTMVYQDLFGTELDLLTRESALQVGGVKKGRALICGAAADAPIKVYRGPDEVATQPTWTYRTDSGVTPWQTWAGVLDDLIFYDSSLLGLKLGADGYPTDLMRVRRNRWEITDGVIRIDGEAVDPKTVLYVPGPEGGNGGLLRTGAADVRAARALAKARTARAVSPVPLVELHQLTDDELEQDEIERLTSEWGQARARNGGVGFTDNRVEVRVHGDKITDFFESAINASRTDIANHLNIPAALLDGTPNTASLTYETREGQAQVFWDSTVPYWLGPLEAALSSDRIVPRGQKVRFDFTSKRGPVPTPAIAGPEIED